MTIKLARVDQRLVHGQIITAVAPSAGVNTIIAVDDTLAKDQVMASITEGTGESKGFKTKVLSIQDAIQAYQDEKYHKRSVLLITRNINDMYELAKNGIEIPELMIGGASPKPNTVKIINEVSITEEDFKQLEEMNHQGTKIYVQVVPSSKRIDYKEIASKF